MKIFNKSTSAGYYLVTIRPGNPGLLIANNSERAFVISQLQDALNIRPYLDAQPLNHLSTHIDLLAFSILKEGIQLLTFSISRASVEQLANIISTKLLEYKEEWPSRHEPSHTGRPTIMIRHLIGPHEALNISVQLHVNHLDWEFDRYSSIGFYLHDRRGSWMRLWRLAHLYDNNSQNYLKLIHTTLLEFQLEDEPQSQAITNSQYVTSAHE